MCTARPSWARSMSQTIASLKGEVEGRGGVARRANVVSCTLQGRRPWLPIPSSSAMRSTNLVAASVAGSTRAIGWLSELERTSSGVWARWRRTGTRASARADAPQRPCTRWLCCGRCCSVQGEPWLASAASHRVAHSWGHALPATGRPQRRTRTLGTHAYASWCSNETTYAIPTEVYD